MTLSGCGNVRHSPEVQVTVSGCPRVTPCRLEQAAPRTNGGLNALLDETEAACPVSFLPYLAWAFSVDRWDEGWTESVKRQVVKDAFYIHQHKGTTSAVRRVVEPFGFLIRIIEWWQTGEAPGTFRLDIGVQDQGITEDTYLELERLISDAKPCSRHMIGMSINLQTSGPHWVGAASYLGEEITIYPYINETIISGGTAHEGGAVHVIDTMRVNP
ncbi:phage tail protein I [Escherichia coli]|uniref:phage tail protein I n=1 Tax=Escherichia coli TaxID=562 RepID=UPI00207D6040